MITQLCICRIRTVPFAGKCGGELNFQVLLLGTESILKHASTNKAKRPTLLQCHNIHLAYVEGYKVNNWHSI